jgi:hypothetical protein
MVAQSLKRTVKHAFCPKRVVRVTGVGGAAGGAAAGTASTARLKVEVVQLLVSPRG